MSARRPGFIPALIESLRLSPKEDACPDGHAERQGGGCQEIWFVCEVVAFNCNPRSVGDDDQYEDDAGGEEVGAHQCRECGVEREECGVVSIYRVVRWSPLP
jgi:hypothetical protein